jgi:hypothetical protein
VGADFPLLDDRQSISERARGSLGASRPGPATNRKRGGDALRTVALPTCSPTGHGYLLRIVVGPSLGPLWRLSGCDVDLPARALLMTPMEAR